MIATSSTVILGMSTTSTMELLLPVRGVPEHNKTWYCRLAGSSGPLGATAALKLAIAGTLVAAATDGRCAGSWQDGRRGS